MEKLVLLQPEVNLEPYTIYKPGDIDVDLFNEVMKNNLINPEKSVSILPFGKDNLVGGELRKLYFEGVIGEDEEIKSTRIVSFGKCNVNYSYCKRGMQFIDENGETLKTVEVKLVDIARLASGAISRGEVVRFSGGDPVVYKREVLALSRFINESFKTKVSIAHNGSGPQWVETMLPYLSSAAIDLKSVPERLGTIMELSETKGINMYSKSLQTQSLISNAGINLDVRTPIFGDTSILDLRRLAGDITKSNNLDNTFWTWRLYKKVDGCDFKIPNLKNVLHLMGNISKENPDLWMGIRAKWTGGGMLYFKNGREISDLGENIKLENV